MDELRVDVAGVVAMVEAVVEFEWTWAVADVDRLCGYLGWEEPGRFGRTETQWWSRTDLAVEDSVATFRIVGDRLDAVTVSVSESGYGSSEFGASAVAELAIALEQIWDEPTDEWISARHGPGWHFGNVAVGICHGATIEVMVVNPLQHDYFSELRRWRGDLAQRIDAPDSRFPEVVSELVRADFGAWSRETVQAVCEGFSCAAPKVTETTDAARESFGYGEVGALTLTTQLSEPAADTVFRAALARCRAALGDPDLIGGGQGGFVTWVGPEHLAVMTREKYRQGRGLDLRADVTIELCLKPTVPTLRSLAEGSESEDMWEEQDAISRESNYDSSHGDVVLVERWHYRPDPDRSLPPRLANAATPIWAADDMNELAHNLHLLFESFADDLRNLPDIPEIGWAIGIYDEPGPLAHGWFTAISCDMDTFDSKGSHARPLLPEGADGRAIVAETLAALHARGSVSPRELWCEAWVPGHPNTLTGIRFGLRGDRPPPWERGPAETH
ncbi:DUF6301 family protein [Nocardia panacis]|uniref:DUF6301 family protein n=1 Tax=Nocardia panacis TaxID=2340916 RepID=UPI0011C3EB8C|nr:DUF6301 family protein [Nocardia panacis]